MLWTRAGSTTHPSTRSDLGPGQPSHLFQFSVPGSTHSGQEFELENLADFCSKSSCVTHCLWDPLDIPFTCQTIGSITSPLQGCGERKEIMHVIVTQRLARRSSRLCLDVTSCRKLLPHPWVRCFLWAIPAFPALTPTCCLFTCLCPAPAQA